jgi:hypothetical protein
MCFSCMDKNRLDHLRNFYNLIDTLGKAVRGPRSLADCTGRLNWPKRGVYFFTETGENRVHTGVGPRIVRVGTHALKRDASTRLWVRLSQHRGQVRSGGGNHRGSIFRLIVGTALIAKHHLDVPTWDDRKSSAPADVRAVELALEREVSKTIGAMPFLWVGIDDEPGDQNARGYIERNAIALLSNFGREALDPPSSAWLGNYCNRERIRASGLWNANHVDETYDPKFLNELQVRIEAMSR